MAMRFKKPLLCLSALALIALAGCAPVNPYYGEAVRYNAAIHTIDPDPQYPADARQPGDHGEKAQKATERYRKGQVKAANAPGASSQ